MKKLRGTHLILLLGVAVVKKVLGFLFSLGQLTAESRTTSLAPWFYIEDLSFWSLWSFYFTSELLYACKLIILTIPSAFCKILESFFECGSHLEFQHSLSWMGVFPTPHLPDTEGFPSFTKDCTTYLRNDSGVFPLLHIPMLLLLLDFYYLGLNHFNSFLTGFLASCLSSPPTQT